MFHGHVFYIQPPKYWVFWFGMFLFNYAGGYIIDISKSSKGLYASMQGDDAKYTHMLNNSKLTTLINIP